MLGYLGPGVSVIQAMRRGFEYFVYFNTKLPFLYLCDVYWGT